MNQPQPSVVVATEASFDLAEGPVWDPIRERVLWVDIRTGRVLVGRLLDDGTIAVEERVDLPDMVGAVAVSEAGDWILAGERQVRTRRGTELEPGPTLLAADSGRRLNDGSIDPAGRFVVGSLKIDETPTEEERLVVVQPDGTLDVLDDDLTLSNGLAWAADGTQLYSIDTGRSTVFVRDYDAATGHAGPRRALLVLDDGHPDGMCLDAAGCLWIAIWGSGQVRRYSAEGELLRTIHIPSPHTSCVAFIGPELTTMVITSASKGLDAEQLAAHPLAGRLFTVDFSTDPDGVRGLPLPLWSGRPH